MPRGRLLDSLVTRFYKRHVECCDELLRQEFELIVGRNTRRFHDVDPWELRKEFLRIPRNTQDLASFLNKCGNWAGPWDDAAPEGSAYFQAERFWEDRETLIGVIKAGVSDWDNSPSDFGLTLIRRSKYPQLILADRLCRDAILHSVTVDLLRGTKFHLCARKDCRTPFAVTNGHKKIFCTQYCGHLVSQRKGRKQEQKLKARRGLIKKR
jgi:hypothetical protein